MVPASRRPAVRTGFHSGFRSGLILVSMLALCSCAELSELFAPSPKETEKQVQTRAYDAPDYVYNLSAAALVLENGGSTKDVAGEIRVADTYSAIKHRKAVTLPLLAIDYQSDHSGGVQRLLVYTGKDGQDTSQLAKLMKRMEAYKPTLQELSVVSVPVKPGHPLKLSRLDDTQALQAIREEQKALRKSIVKTPWLDAAQIHIALLEYFIKNRKKDAAYLSADMAKRELAKAARKTSHVEESSKLSSELAALEGQLREVMPY